MDYIMLKTLVTSISLLTLTLTLATAHAGQDQHAAAAENNTTAADQELTNDQQVSVMDLPVNFSTTEDIDKSLQAVREQAGEAQERDLKNAIQYLMTYDLSVRNDKQKLYKKLDGRTPNQIISKIKR